MICRSHAKLLLGVGKHREKPGGKHVPADVNLQLGAMANAVGVEYGVELLLGTIAHAKAREQAVRAKMMCQTKGRQAKACAEAMAMPRANGMCRTNETEEGRAKTRARAKRSRRTEGQPTEGQPTKGQQAKAPASAMVFEVDRIKAVKKRSGAAWLYEVTWKDYPGTDWLPKQNFTKGALKILMNERNARNPTKRRREATC
jgi:hypothetical protein